MRYPWERDAEGSLRLYDLNWTTRLGTIWPSKDKPPRWHVLGSRALGDRTMIPGSPFKSERAARRALLALRWNCFCHCGSSRPCPMWGHEADPLAPIRDSIKWLRNLEKDLQKELKGRP